MAPDSRCRRPTARNLTLDEPEGRKVVLYFYPKDDTSGCTLEAQNFQSLNGHFAAAGHGNRRHLAGRHEEPRQVSQQIRASTSPSPPTKARRCSQTYGVWVEKSMYGRKYMGVERTTMLIDRDGKIARIWEKVKVPGHAEEVLAAAKALP